ncbi:hypothetical protein KXD93_13450 [Mucilaginibacter sp. BJC16-A38]|uniref:hypothetical protein n=1 Tax=Mucilaginibacter phenanthrenivorans TaxID=1234842 RepID=UPI00215850DE|nr:hypothetical protein [Mucilaginibacter phenanthrenivorans]MCR8558656.1 hypothetical protein [Mucilaginibacter phenanthrenivorans]
MKTLINILLVIIGFLFLFLVYRALIVDETTPADHWINSAFSALILITIFLQFREKRIARKRE